LDGDEKPSRREASPLTGCGAERGVAERDAYSPASIDTTIKTMNDTSQLD
jgi:hypothetical protein